VNATPYDPTTATDNGDRWLSATDLEICDAIRQLEARRAALAVNDPVIYDLNSKLNERRLDLVFNRRKRQRK